MKTESPGDASGGGKRRVNPRSGGKIPSSPTPALPCSLPRRPARHRYLRAALPPSRHTHTGRLSSRRRGSAPRSGRPALGQGTRPGPLRDFASRHHFPAGLKGRREKRADEPSPPHTRPPRRYRNSPAGTGSRSPFPPQRAPLSPIYELERASCRLAEGEHEPEVPPLSPPAPQPPPLCARRRRGRGTVLALLLPRPLASPARARSLASGLRGGGARAPPPPPGAQLPGA